MGLLELFKTEGKKFLKDALPGGLLNPEITKQSVLDTAAIASTSVPVAGDVMGLLADVNRYKEDPSSRTAGNFALSGLGLLPFVPAMTVWHGSPHKFDKFDMSKIGTGEGAQAYGHGLYMAESPAVATEYRNKLSTGYMGGDGSLTHYGDAYQTAYDAAQSAGATRPDHARAIASQVQEWVDSGKKASTFMRYNSVPKELEPAYKAATDAWKTFKPNEGSLYKVDIPDEAVARFLDWDKKLSEQAPEVKAYAEKVLAREMQAAKSPTDGWGDLSAPFNIMDEMTGSQFLQRLRDGKISVDNIIGGGGADVSNSLRQQGIPGIRYLDGGSRSAGQGSSNFVLFSDDLPRILETNGVPTGLQPWQPGEWQGLLR